MSDDKPPLERAVDLLVYAPIGLVLTAREELPRLIDRGRTQAEGQLGMARVVGQFAVNKGQKEAEKLVQRAAERLADLGLVGTPTPAPEERRASSPAPTPEGEGERPSPAQPAAEPERPSAASLAIPGYDALSAPQVVQRLAGLAAEELEAVRAYEAATRGRKTILSRIAQLQSVAT